MAETETTFTFQAGRPATVSKRIVKPLVYIGIDPGVNTGMAIWDAEQKHFVAVSSVMIYEAIEYVKRYHAAAKILVRIEDARMRRWFGNTGKERMKGAGSVERDCKIWEETMTLLQIPFEFVHPKNVQATTADYFKKLTGWQGRTNIHGREAAIMVFGK